MDSLRRKLVDRFVAATNTPLNSREVEASLSTSYSESTLRQYWMPDAVSDDCYECAAKFTAFRRKHHCRICGQIFCSKCCGIFISGKYLKVTGSLRVCTVCYKFFEDNLRAENAKAEENLGAPARATAESPGSDSVGDRLAQRFSQLATRSGSESDLSASCTSLPTRKSSYAGFIPSSFMSESCDNISALANTSASGVIEHHLDFEKLLLIWQKMSEYPTQIQTGVHKYKGKLFPDTFLGEELIIWLYENQEMTNMRKEAIDLAQALLDGELIEDVSSAFSGVKDELGGPRFNASVPYKLKKKKPINEDIIEENESNSDTKSENLDMAPEWLQNMDFASRPERHALPENSTQSLLSAPKASSFPPQSPVEHEDLNLFLKDPSATKASSEIPCPILEEVYVKHQEAYLEKLLTAERLDKAKWSDFIKINCEKLLGEVELMPEVNPWTSQISMDIRDLVKIKCIFGGDLSESCIVRGEVFTNQVVRAEMPLNLNAANMLLVQDAISYHRTDKFVSIANLHLVEEEFVKNICNKVKALSPDLILVGQNVCRLAQDILTEAGICVIQNVKEKNLKRIARLFSTPMLTSLGSMIHIPRLGTCEKYHSEYFEEQGKNLIFLEGSNATNKYGCCIVLRGGSLKELAKVKRVMKQLLLVKTHAKFEKAFLLDESAQVENFIIPDHKNCHLLTLSLSPFIEFPFPDDHMELDAEMFDQEEDFEILEMEEEAKSDNQQPKSYGVFDKPLVLTRTLKQDVKVRNLLADYRACSSRPGPQKRPVKEVEEPAPRFYKVLDKQVPMCFSSYLSNPEGGGSRYCIKPWVSIMSLYKAGDVPLGVFLHSYCFDKNYRCRSTQDLSSLSSLSQAAAGLATAPSGGSKAPSLCPIPMSDHGRRFCLGNTSVTMIIQTLNNPISKLAREQDDEQIVMWKFCPMCRTMTDLMPLSSKAWMMSYAMFLLLLTFETKMVRRDVIKCDHSLHNEQYTCFGKGNMIAFFQMQRVLPHGTRMPPRKIALPHHFPNEKDLREEIKHLSILGSKVFGKLNEKVVQLENECFSSGVIKSVILDMNMEQELDCSAYRKHLDEIIVSLNDESDLRDLVKARSDTMILKIAVIKNIYKWRTRFAQFFELKRKEDKNLAKAATSRARVASGNNLLANDDSISTTSSTSLGDLKKQPKEKALSSTPGLTELEFGTLENPFKPTIHPSLFIRPNLLVDEAQPSTIIAYALGSREHLEHLSNAAGEKQRHLDYQFGDEINDSKFYVKIHFASEFDQFRRQIFEPGSAFLEDFMASMSACDSWQTSGGKSGATFYKTSDERFLLKQVNKHEMITFQNIALRYFDYITKNEDRTLMAKIVGLYTVGYKTALSCLKTNVIVLENLFYGHKIAESYDLKGSMRNRLVDPQGNKGKELVLMDENLLRMACEKPFYVRHKTKKVLIEAVIRDSSFLSDIKVMDYSLLVGKDEVTHELIVGIIDYLRPFSIDKMIESQMKKTSGYFQGTAEDPTVISPLAYQSRFILAMDNYFVLLPDIWYDPNVPKEQPDNKESESSASVEK